MLQIVKKMAKKRAKKKRDAKRPVRKKTSRTIRPIATPVRTKKFSFKPVAAIIVLIIIVAIGMLLQGEEKNYYEFTACMSESGLIEIGSDTCIHCENQKRILGHDAFSVNFDGNGKYLRCNLDPLLCSELGISSIPTWYMPSETGIPINAQGNVFSVSGTYDKHLGEQSIYKLAEITGCQLPEGYDPSKTIQASDGFTKTG